MGSNWSTNARVDGLPRKETENNSCGKPSFAGDVPSFPTISAGSAFPKFVQPEYPKFSPTLFFVDITTKDVVYSQKIERRRRCRVVAARSKIFLYSPSDGHFMMTFKVSNPEFMFLQVKDRPATEEQNTRSTQVCTTTKIVKKKHPSYVFPLHVKTYTSGENIATTPSNNNNDMTKPTDSASNHGDRFDGHIMIAKDDMKFVLPMKGEIGIGKQFRHSNSNNEIGNCYASLLVKVGTDGDICRVNFDIEDIEFSTVLLKTSRGCQASDQRMYYKTRGTIKPVIYVALPISTYVYQDPMVQIRLRNRKQHLHGCEPSWMTEVRRVRVQSSRVQEDDEETRPSYSRMMPSSFVVERGGYILRARTEMLRAQITDGSALYDEFVRAHSSDLSKFNENVYESFCELPSLTMT